MPPPASVIADPVPGGKGRSTRPGFTLVEVIVALGLFALISLAGFTLLRTVLDTQDRTELRLQRLAEIQRALFVVVSDLDQVSGGMQGGGDTLSFDKTDAAGRALVVQYSLRNGVLTRSISGPFGDQTQSLLEGIIEMRWSFRLSGLGWAPVVASGTFGSDAALLAPPVSGVALDLVLYGTDGNPVSLRRMIATPETAS